MMIYSLLYREIELEFCANNIDLHVQRPTSRDIVYRIFSLDVGSIDVCNF
jgi:hypothetical protein